MPGGGVIFIPEIYVADFGNFKQGLLGHGGWISGGGGGTYVVSSSLSVLSSEQLKTHQERSLINHQLSVYHTERLL